MRGMYVFHDAGDAGGYVMMGCAITVSYPLLTLHEWTTIYLPSIATFDIQRLLPRLYIYISRMHTCASRLNESIACSSVPHVLIFPTLRLLQVRRRSWTLPPAPAPALRFGVLTFPIKPANGAGVTISVGMPCAPAIQWDFVEGSG